jgi:hypothetical protein
LALASARGGAATATPAAWFGRAKRSKLLSTSTCTDSLSTVGAWIGAALAISMQPNPPTMVAAKAVEDFKKSRRRNISVMCVSGSLQCVSFGAWRSRNFLRAPLMNFHDDGLEQADRPACRATAQQIKGEGEQNERRNDCRVHRCQGNSKCAKATKSFGDMKKQRAIAEHHGALPF